MRKVKVSMEVSFRMGKEIWVTEEDYSRIEHGELPDNIYNGMNDEIIADLEHCWEEVDWAAVDGETGEVLQEWG